jgi:hypothetical protein
VIEVMLVAAKIALMSRSSLIFAAARAFLLSFSSASLLLLLVCPTEPLVPLIDP